jgi:membrane protein implicated in regulation of membrane protease activity
MRQPGLERSTLVVAGVATLGLIATVFAHTFMWAAVMALLAVAPAVALLLAERARRRVERPSTAKPDHGGPRVPRSSAA